MAGLSGSSPKMPSGVDELFAHLFGNDGRTGFTFEAFEKRPRRRGNSVTYYDVTLEDLYNGKTVKINLEKEIVCGQCDGCVSYTEPLSINFSLDLKNWRTEEKCEARPMQEVRRDRAYLSS